MSSNSNPNSSTHKTPSDLSPPSNKRKQPLHTEEEKQPTKKRQVIKTSNNDHNNNNHKNNNNNKIKTKNSKKNKTNPTQNNPKNKNNSNQNKNNILQKNKHPKGNGTNNKKTPIVRKGVQKKKENPNIIPLIKSQRMNTTTTTPTPPFRFLPPENLNIEQIEQFVDTQLIHITKMPTISTTVLQKSQEELFEEQFVETQPIHTTKTPTISTTILQKTLEDLNIEQTEQFVETQLIHTTITTTSTTTTTIPPFKSLPHENLEFRHLADVTKKEGEETTPIFIEFPFCPFVSIDAQKKGEHFLIKRGNFSSGWLMKNKLKILNILQRNEIALDLPQAISLRSWVLSSNAAKSHFLVERYAPEVFNLYEKRNRDIKGLAKQFKISPVTLFKSILLSRGWPKSSIKKELETTLRQILKIPPKSVPILKEETTEKKNKKMDNNNSNTRELILSDRDKKELLIAHQHDEVAPLIDDTLVHATNFEVNVAKFFQSRGVEFYTQSELIAHQQAQIGKAVSTPDLLVKPHQHVTVKLNGHEHRIHWIEVKMMFGSDIHLQQKSIHSQILKYKKYFGFGLLVFSFGCVDKIFDQYLKGGICLCVDSRIVGVQSELGLVKPESVENKK